LKGNPLTQNQNSMPEMRLNPVTLSFQGDCRHLEQEFLLDYTAKSLNHIRIALLLSTFLYVAFGFLDAQLVPDHKAQLWFIRYAIMCPALIVGVLLTFWSRFHKYMQGCIAILTVMAGSGIIIMVAIAPPPANFSYYAGVILVFMTGYGFIKARFVWAIIAGWINVIFYEVVAIWVVQTPAPVLLNNNFFFISANIIGMFVCYSIEFYTRKNFYMARRLEFEQGKVISLNRNLEQRVLDRTAEIAQTNKKLHKEIDAHQRAKEQKERLEKQLLQSQKMEAIGTLAGGIAHDFNNILSAIIGNTELAESNLPEGNEARNNLQKVLTSSFRARDLVQQILTLSREDQGESKKPMLLGGITKEILKLLHATLPATIEIRSDVQQDTGSINASPDQIHRLLMNLCTNGAQAMAENGGVLHVSLANVAFDPEEAARHYELEPGKYVKLTITDTGHGLDEATMERIFEPYFTTKEQGKGTGLGLAIVHGIVKNHHAHIKVQSKPGKGTSFQIFFPRIEAPVKFENHADTPPPKGTERVLVVDDEKFIATMLQEMLTSLGYNAVSLTQSLDALSLFRENPDDFDLVITDTTMPGMTGDVLATEMLTVRPDIPIILCTGYSERVSKEQAETMGIRSFLEKPIRMKVLADAVRRVLDDDHQQGTAP
jgi:signal transduction histidine kinase/CheY-like chemotaxis protein